MRKDTIFALGTGAARSAIAIIRLSGPASRKIIEALCGQCPEPRHAAYTKFCDPQTRGIIDSGIALFFPAPASPTGEDYAELQFHGGRAVIDAMIGAIRRRDLARVAEAGEFVRRAFENGKLDLSQVEAIADLIDAETEFQRRQAARLASGELRKQVEAWRADVLNAMAIIESQLDFSDEADIGSPSLSSLGLENTIASIERALGSASQGERMRCGFTVMIVGAPNAGKSTLLNALMGRDMAIVSSIPGTTRDMIEARLDLAGAPVTLIDTAGLRDASEGIEKLGVDLVYRRLGDADLVLWLSENGAKAPAAIEGNVLCVATKSDRQAAEQDLVDAQGPAWLSVSALTGAGMDRLRTQIADFARRTLGDGGTAILAQQRQYVAANEALGALRRICEDKPLELTAEDLRSAANSLGRITGSVNTEEVLGVIFGRFCIGK